MILPGMTIGIIGGGQLGKMLAISANTMGYRVITLDPAEDAPAASVSHEHLVGALDDEQALETLVKKSDVVTYEFENIDATCITALQKRYGNIPQGAMPLYLSQHREREKDALVAAGLQVVPYCSTVDIEQDITKIIALLDFPLVIKTAEGGYDGKGQAVLQTKDDIHKIEQFKEVSCVVEKYIQYEKECSIVATRGLDGVYQSFPIAQNKHTDNILEKSIVEEQLFPDLLRKRMSAMVKQFMEYHQLCGIMAMEFFVSNGDVYVNEIAPRPHNSGHFTIEGCATSQFEQLIRVICRLPQGATTLHGPTYMYNILGQHVEPLEAYLKQLPPSAHIHLYGKKGKQKNRKMGHITFVNPTIRELLTFETQVLQVHEQKFMDKEK